MDLEDLQSDLNALKKLYGILQSKGNNTLQASGSENLLDEKSKQLLKKLLDGATEEAIQCHSKVIAEKSSAPLLPDSFQQLPTSKQLPDLPRVSKLSKEKEVAEERDECQRHHQKNQKPFDAEESSQEQKICMKSHVKRKVSPGEKISSSYCSHKTQMMKKNHIRRPPHKRGSETRQNQSIVGLPPPGFMDSPMLCNRLMESRSLKLSHTHEKEAETTISEEAAMAIRRIEDHLPPASHVTNKEENSTLPGQMLIQHQHPSPVKELLICSHANDKSQVVEPTARPSELPNQQMMMSQKTENMDSAPDHGANGSGLNRSTNQMCGPTQGKAKEYQRSRSQIADMVVVKDRVGLHYKAHHTPEKNEDDDHQMPTQSRIVKDSAFRNASGAVHKKEVGPDRATQTREIGLTGAGSDLVRTVQMNRKVGLIEEKVSLQLVGPTLERTKSRREKQRNRNEDEAKGPDQKRNQRTMNEWMEMERKISAPSSEKGAPKPVRQRVTEVHQKKGKVVHPQSKIDQMGSTIDRGPSRPDRLLSRTKDTSRDNPDLAKQKRLRRQLTWKELPRQTKGKQVHGSGTSTSATGTSRTTHSTTGSSASRINASPSMPSQQGTAVRKNRREQLPPSRMLTHRAVEAERRPPRRTTTCRTGSPVSRTSNSSPSPSQRVTTRGKIKREQQPPNRTLTHRATVGERRQPHRTTTHHAGPTTRTPPLPPPSRGKSLTNPKNVKEEKESAPHLHSKVARPRHVGPTNPSPSAGHHQAEEKPKGRLRRFKNKLAVIFHHHHHHHHHHHLGHHGETNGQDGDDEDHGGGPHALVEHHLQHRSLWRYLREVVHHSSKEDHVKLAAETRGERATGNVGKAMVKIAPRKQHQGMMEWVLKHMWHSRRKEDAGGKEHRKRLWKSGSSKHNKKKVKLHWWQRFHKRKGVKLGNRKKNKSLRRSKDKTA